MLSKASLQIFGIRHHGAGSARRLITALHAIKPSAIAIELPSDSLDMVKQLASMDHQPPIAFLYYDKRFPSRSIYLPMAIFSPEYQAIQYAIEHQIPVHCIDLPAAAFLRPSNFTGNETAFSSRRIQSITADPIGYLATHAGFKDSERWWENQFEQWTEHLKLFEVIQQFMSELRRQSQWKDDRETLLREKYMRCRLRNILSEHKGSVAVVCGAWHGPVLTQEWLDQQAHESPPILKLSPVSTCIIPWTYQHIQLNQFYTAGIRAPSWHESLFLDPLNAVSLFLSKAAHLLRKEGIEISTDALISASRLANHLCLLRELPQPGLVEILEAALTTFNLDKSRDWLEDKILCGNVTGVVSIEQMNLPFVRQFHEQLKKLKLKPWWTDGGREELLLDLRKEHHLNISKFLHYCSLCLKGWCIPAQIEWKAQGSFHENWNFRWHPELEMQLIALGCLGNTLSDVLFAFTRQKFSKPVGLIEIARCLEHSLKGDWTLVWPLLSHELETTVVAEQEFTQLSALLPYLVSMLEYGSLHQNNLEMVATVYQQLLIKLICELEPNCMQIQEERARHLFNSLNDIQLHFSKHPDHPLHDQWYDKLSLICLNDACHPLLRGKCWGIRLFTRHCTVEQAIQAFQTEFSLIAEAIRNVHWLEGLVNTSTSLFLIHPEIIKTIDVWMNQLEEKTFTTVLPLLRRCFSVLPENDKVLLLNRFQQMKPGATPAPDYFIANQRREMLVNFINRIKS